MTIVNPSALHALVGLLAALRQRKYIYLKKKKKKEEIIGEDH